MRPPSTQSGRVWLLLGGALVALAAGAGAVVAVILLLLDVVGS